MNLFIIYWTNENYSQFSIILFFSIPLSADEIIQDKNGDFFLMKDDGTFKKLPRPKPGHKYVIKKTKKYLEDKNTNLF